MSTRSNEIEKQYQEDLKLLQSKIGYCPFHDGNKEPNLRENYWGLYKNNYPYKWANEHWLLFPARHTNKLNEEETKELEKILKEWDDLDYVCLRNPDVLTSVWCYHYHIIKPYIPNDNN